VIRTTDLAVIRKHPEHFTWGPVLEIIDFRRYTIVRYDSTPSGPTRDFIFHVYVDGRDTSHGTHHFEEAVLIALAFGVSRTDASRYAAIAARKVLGLPGEP
jgi:hypothetical protein